MAYEGMLWFRDKTRDDLVAQIHEAADYFRVKYGSWPTLCLVHPSMLPLELDEIEVQSSNSVLPGHWWLGRNKDD